MINGSLSRRIISTPMYPYFLLRFEELFFTSSPVTVIR